MKAPSRDSRTLEIWVPGGPTGKINDPEDPLIGELHDELSRSLRQAQEGTVVHLLFDKVALSASCHAAVLAPVLEEIVQGRLKNKHVLGVDPSGLNAWDADAGLAKESKSRSVKLVCPWRGFEGHVELVGDVDDQVNATYLFVVREGETTARELAEQSGVSIQAASNRFAKAAKLGIIAQSGRRSVPGGGVENIYRAIC